MVGATPAPARANQTAPPLSCRQIKCKWMSEVLPLPRAPHLVYPPRRASPPPHLTATNTPLILKCAAAMGPQETQRKIQRRGTITHVTEDHSHSLTYEGVDGGKPHLPPQ